MFVPFFFGLRKAGVPVTLREFLTLLEGMRAGVPEHDVEKFYYFARAALVKDERHLDRFDVAFGSFFRGLQPPKGEAADGPGAQELPEEWLRKMAELYLTDEEKKEIETLGGFEKLMETLRRRLEEQKDRHQGGNKWIGTAGRSPFGAYGYNPEGVRIGQHESRHRRAVKVWDKRVFKNLDDTVELGTRNIKVALRRLRKFARTGAAEELDLPSTIKSTAHNGGLLDLQMRPERHNAVKVILALDIGGSMDDHIRICEELFSAARSEFKHLEYYYFHNCPYETLWKDNRRRHAERILTWDVLNTYPRDYKLVFVGDASMSPYEVSHPGGSVEHFNEEPGAVWLHRMTQRYPKAAWLNPVKEAYWGHTHSIGMIHELMEGRMFPLTLDGLDRAMRVLT